MSTTNPEHAMLREILEQPDALVAALRGRLKFVTRKLANGTELADTEFGDDIAALAPDRVTGGVLWTPKTIRLFGHGTSLYAGMVAKYAFEKLAGISVFNELGADFRDRFPIPQNAAAGTAGDRIFSGDDELGIAVSQSGETTDTVGAARQYAYFGGTLLALCNAPQSTLAREFDGFLDVRAGKEIAIASTKAFTNQVAVLLALALKFAVRKHGFTAELKRFAGDLEHVSFDVRQLLRDAFDDLANYAGDIWQFEDIYFIGRGPLYPAALEGALKMKETAGIHAEGYQSAEVKHGPFSLLDNKWALVSLATGKKGTVERDATLCVSAESLNAGAFTIGILDKDENAKDGIPCFNNLLLFPPVNPLIAPIPVVVALQQLAYHTACKRGKDIDKPRNLTKAVLVNQ
jgi:glucosamine--fructose-6-phosphate aminotransferase (isomerizing)